MLSDAEGNPLVVQTTPANVPDQVQLRTLLGARPAVQGPRGRPRRNPEPIIGDRAYGTKEMVARVEGFGIESLLAPRADDTHGSGLGVLRYVIERTLACFRHFRRLRHCYERWGEHFQAFHDLAAALLICSRITSRGLPFGNGLLRRLGARLRPAGTDRERGLTADSTVPRKCHLVS